RILAEQTLEAEKAFANTLIEMAQTIILVLDEGGRILRTNSYLRQISGYRTQELEDQLWARFLLVESERAAAEEWLETRPGLRWRRTGTFALRTKDGAQRTTTWYLRALPQGSGAGAVVLLIGHDITELEEAQTRALQAERLAAIGEVMTGLA